MLQTVTSSTLESDNIHSQRHVYIPALHTVFKLFYYQKTFVIVIYQCINIPIDKKYYVFSRKNHDEVKNKLNQEFIIETTDNILINNPFNSMYNNYIHIPGNAKL